MRIWVTSVFVDDQPKALAFYTGTLGFRKKTEVPLGEYSWLTVVAPDDPDGGAVAAGAGRASGRAGGEGGAGRRRYPVDLVAVTDLAAEYERLRTRGVVFTQEPADMGAVITAVFDDTCGNLIQLTQLT